MLGLTLIILTDILYISISLTEEASRSKWGSCDPQGFNSGQRRVRKYEIINLTQIQNTTEKKHKWGEKGTAFRNKTLLKLEQ